MSILLIGPRTNKLFSTKTGGIIVLFEDLVSYCDEHNISYRTIDTNKDNYTNKLFAFFVILFKLIVNIPKSSHVSLHGTANDYLFIAPITLIISKVFRKPLSLRKFAGNYIEIYKNYSFLKKKIISFLLKNVSYSFFETKYLVEYFKKYNNTFWFPNVRRKQVRHVDTVYRKKFIFIGSVCKEKGIEVLSNAAKLLPEEYIIDIYGNLSIDFPQEYFDKHQVNYIGRLKLEDVIDTLLQYDVLVLPSFREGYPGVILEALSIGMPVIATKLEGIQEILENHSGILIETANIKELSNAILSISQDNYSDYSSLALKNFKKFDTEVRTKEFFTRINIYE